MTTSSTRARPSAANAKATTTVAAYSPKRALAPKASALLLLVAGFETTVNLIGNGFLALVTHQDELAKLRDDATLWPNAIEEMLRWDPPVQYTGRAATAAIDIDGVAISPRKPIAVLIGGANRDPGVFADPARFDVTRENAREHLAFAAGVHYCLGAGLARLEGQVALEVLLNRHPDAAVIGPTRRRRTRLLRGYDSIPLSLPSPNSVGDRETRAERSAEAATSATSA